MALSRAPINTWREPTEEEEGTIRNAAETDDVVTLRKLISSGVDVTGSVGGYNKTALHYAADKGNNSVVSALITAGANVNAVTDISKKTALHFAAENGNNSVVSALITVGADVNATDKDNRTALHYAAGKGSSSVVSALITAGANVNAVTDYKNTALHYAAQKGNNSVVSALITAGVNVNATNNGQNTPVHFAAYHGHTDVVAMLVANGGDVNMKDKDGDTPLDDAVNQNHSGVVFYMIQNGGIDLTKFDQEKQQKIRDFITFTKAQPGSTQRKVPVAVATPPRPAPQHNLTTPQLKLSAAQTSVQASSLANNESSSIADLSRQFKLEKLKTKALESKCQELNSKCHELDSKCQELDSKCQELHSNCQEVNANYVDLEGKYKESITKSTYLEDNVIPALLERLDTLEAAMYAVERLWVISRNDVHLHSNILGTGGWGVVQEATYKGQRVAAKRMHEDIISEYNKNLFLKEIRLMAKCHHKNLLEFIGAVPDEPAIIVLELMHSTLRKALKNGSILSQQVQRVCQDVAEGLRYLHNIRPKPIIHRDVSAANVLLKSDDGGWIAKISDFGSAQFAHLAQTPGPGAAVYAAPEVTGPPRQQTVKIDVYSFGVLLVEILSKEIPTKKISTYLQSLEAKWPKYVAISRSCVDPNPDRRPMMTKVLTDLGNM